MGGGGGAGRGGVGWGCLGGGHQILPFVSRFYGSPSKFLWEDETGDPLTPMLFAIGQHRAIEGTQACFGVGELSTTYTQCADQNGSVAVHVVVEEAPDQRPHPLASWRKRKWCGEAGRCRVAR